MKIETKEQLDKICEENKQKELDFINKRREERMNSDKSGMCIAGFVLSLVGLFFFGFLCGVLAIIFSSIGLTSSKNSEFAIAGLAIGIVDMIFGFIFIPFWLIVLGFH